MKLLPRSVALIVWLAFATTDLAAAASPSKYWDDPKVRALAEAAGNGNVKKIEQLVKEGVPINAVGREGYIPLAYTLLKLNKTGFSTLLKHGADPDIPIAGLFGGDGSLACLTAQGTETFWLEELAAAGANLNIASKIGQSPIFYAISYNRVANAKVLLKHKIDLEFADNSQFTPLLTAALYNKWEIAHLLIEAGADWKKTSSGGNRSIVDLLRTYTQHPGVDRKGSFWQWRGKVILLLKSKGADIPADLLATVSDA